MDPAMASAPCDLLSNDFVIFAQVSIVQDFVSLLVGPRSVTKIMSYGIAFDFDSHGFPFPNMNNHAPR